MADELDPFDDIFGDEPAKNARVVGKFRPKPKFQPQKKVPAKSSVASSQSVQTVHSAPPHDSIESFQTEKPLEQSSSALPNDNTKPAGQTSDSAPSELNQTFKNAEQLEQGSEAVPNDKSDLHAKSVEESADFIMGSEVGSDFLLHTNVDSAENDLIPTFQSDDIVDLSLLGLTRTSPTESASEPPLNEESINPMEAPQMDSNSHMEGLPEIPANLASRRAKTGESKSNSASDPHPQQEKASTSSLENGAGRSLRPRKRDSNIRELVDEDGDETLASGEFSKERPFSSTIDEENINIEQPQVESEPQQKDLKRKSKKTENDKEKPPRKSKKAKEASEQETLVKQKKFKHSTRRRQVDKNLLDIPEEEFNPREVSLRDLILLAEHREKQMKIGAAAAGAPATQQSTGNSDYNNNPAGQYSTERAGQYDNDEEDGPIAEDTTEYFNYQSRMEKTPRGKWTKPDNELFYEAVQQFGTDFSMIAQLFPGRSREQIRNKYKKEERQHPLRLREALTNRFRDNSHFQKVIENLNKIRQEEEENYEDFTSTDGQDEEASNVNNDDEGKQEHAEEEENGDRTNDHNEVRIPADAKAEEKEKEKEKKKEEEEEEEEEEEKEEEYDEEDEMFLFSQYKSDM